MYSGGAGGSSALGFALCGQAVKISAMSSIKAAPKKAFALVFELFVFILKTSLKYVLFFNFSQIIQLPN